MLCSALLRFRLVDSDRNRDRVYEIELGRDLLGTDTVTLRYGRAGRRLREITHPLEGGGGATALARQTLRRRLSARRRIGSAYVLTCAEGACQQLVGFWHREGGADGRTGAHHRGRLETRRRTRKPAAVPAQLNKPPPLPLFAA